MRWLSTIAILLGVALMEHLAQKIYAVSQDVNDLWFFAGLQVFFLIGGAIGVWCDWNEEQALKKDFERFRTWWE